jgi:hypothetical protein
MFSIYTTFIVAHNFYIHTLHVSILIVDHLRVYLFTSVLGNYFLFIILDDSVVYGNHSFVTGSCIGCSCAYFLEILLNLLIL